MKKIDKEKGWSHNKIMKNIAENEIKSSFGVSERKKDEHKQKQKEEFVNVPKEHKSGVKNKEREGERGRLREKSREKKNIENAPRKASGKRR